MSDTLEFRNPFMREEDVRRIELLKEKKRRILATQRLEDFSRFMGNEPAKHHLIICRELVAAMKNKGSRLMLFAPPGSAKSTYSSHMFAAYYLACRSNKNIVAACHTKEFAEHNGNKVRSIITSDEFKSIFPKVELTKESRAKSNFQTTIGSSYYGVGVGGAPAGRRADLILIDDPIKSRKDADSPTTRQHMYDWFESDIKTRLKPGGSIIIINTRWHEDDLCGRLLLDAETGKGEKWRVLSFEAIREDMETHDPMQRRKGEALWPEWQSLEELEKIRENSSRRLWESLYQQRPRPLDGDMVNVDWFQNYSFEEIKTESLEVFLSIDCGTAKTERADPTAMQVWGKKDDQHYYLLDVVNEKLEFVELMDKTQAVANKWRPKRILVEKKGAGEQLLQVLGNGKSFWKFVACEPRKLGSKDFRFDLVTPYFSNRKIFVPEEAPWCEMYKQQLLSYPNSAHDDQVDATSQYLAWDMPRGKRGVGKVRG